MAVKKVYPWQTDEGKAEYNQTDGLDVYDEDYSQVTPIPKKVTQVDDLNNTESANVDTNASSTDTTKDKETQNTTTSNPDNDAMDNRQNYATADKYTARTADGRTLQLPLHNSLRNYSSFNYRIGLYALTNDELNNPDESYKIKKPQYAILQSGGGLGDKKVLTAYETANKKAEYFINALEIETIIAPTRKKGSTNAVGFRLEITEPYSMGLFLQTLQLDY